MARLLVLSLSDRWDRQTGQKIKIMGQTGQAENKSKRRPVTVKTCMIKLLSVQSVPITFMSRRIGEFHCLSTCPVCG